MADDPETGLDTEDPRHPDYVSPEKRAMMEERRARMEASRDAPAPKRKAKKKPARKK